jgi:hypothetical protein
MATIRDKSSHIRGPADGGKIVHQTALEFRQEFEKEARIIVESRSDIELRMQVIHLG